MQYTLHASSSEITIKVEDVPNQETQSNKSKGVGTASTQPARTYTAAAELRTRVGWPGEQWCG